MLRPRTTAVTRIAPLAVALVLVIVSTAVSAETVRINGSGSGLHMMKPFIAAYTKAYPGITIDMEKPLGSSGSIKALIGGAMDLAVTSRDLKPEETAAGAVLVRYGNTPLAIVANRDVGTKNLTRKELVDLFNAAAPTWPDGKPVRLIMRPVEDADTKIVRKLSPEIDAAMVAAQSRPGMMVAVTDPEAIEAIARTPGALGFSGMTGVIVEKLPLNVLTLDGIQPTPENLASGKYPMTKALDFVTLKNPPEAVKKFLAFVYSKEGRKIAGAVGVQVTAGEKPPW